MLAWIQSLLSVLVVSLISLVGILTLWLNDRRLRGIVLYLVSFSAGSLLGTAFIHLIPEAIEKNSITAYTSILVILGILVSLVIERFLQWRHCHIPTSEDHPHSFAYMNFLGDAVHNLIDGIIIGSSYMVNTPVGVSTTVAVILHEIPQELGDFGVLVYGGFKRRRALLLNFVTALTSVGGVLLALILGSILDGFTPMVIPFAAGSFIYIAASDLIPELRRDACESKKDVLHIIFLILGVATMLVLLLLE